MQKSLIMEIRIYATMECFKHGKTMYCARVSDLDSFSFADSLNVFRSIYGKSVLIVFLCV